jgi:catechol 2,3-dioxygenase-like lactoylglutathione lyase family enzyme
LLERLDHVVIAVADLDAARDRFASLLGRTPAWTGPHPQFGTHNVIFNLSNTYIELLAPVGEGLVADSLRARLDDVGEGLFALALGTADAEAAEKTLRERGLHPSSPVSGLAQDGPSGAFRRFRNVMLPPTDTAGIGLFVIEQLSEPELLPPSLPIGPESGSVSALDHVVIMTADPERALDLYGEKLGIRLALDRSFEKRGVRLLFFRLGGTTIEIGASIGAETREDPAADRLWGIALQVVDVDQAHARVSEAGFDLTGVRDGHKSGTRVFSVKGNPLGVPTLFIQPSD